MTSPFVEKYDKPPAGSLDYAVVAEFACDPLITDTLKRTGWFALLGIETGARKAFEYDRIVAYSHTFFFGIRDRRYDQPDDQFRVAYISFHPFYIKSMKGTAQSWQA